MSPLLSLIMRACEQEASHSHVSCFRGYLLWTSDAPTAYGGILLRKPLRCERCGPVQSVHRRPGRERPLASPSRRYAVAFCIG
jgi:hypothetical protein